MLGINYTNNKDIMDKIFVTLCVVVTLMFFLSGVDKVLNLHKVSVGLQHRLGKHTNLHFYTFIILMAALLEIAAPIFIVYSAVTGKQKKMARDMAIYLMIFTVLATLIYHFPPKGKVYYPFISNVTTIGALGLIAYIFNRKC